MSFNVNLETKKLIQNRITLIIIFLATIGVSFSIGDSVGQRTMLKALAPQLSGVQAMLLADKISRQRELLSYMRAQCIEESIDEIDVDQDRGMQVLMDLLRDSDDASRRYIQVHEPGLLDEAANYKARYPNKILHPTCSRLGANK
jgi:hypothetical protein